jgi:hypothetical protein
VPILLRLLDPAIVTHLGAGGDRRSAIFHAVYAGHRFARELDTEPAEIAFARERTALAS